MSNTDNTQLYLQILQEIFASKKTNYTQYIQNVLAPELMVTITGTSATKAKVAKSNFYQNFFAAFDVKELFSSSAYNMTIKLTQKEKLDGFNPKNITKSDLKDLVNNTFTNEIQNSLKTKFYNYETSFVSDYASSTESQKEIGNVTKHIRLRVLADIEQNIPLVNEEQSTSNPVGKGKKSSSINSDNLSIQSQTALNFSYNFLYNEFKKEFEKHGVILVSSYKRVKTFETFVKNTIGTDNIINWSKTPTYHTTLQKSAQDIVQVNSSKGKELFTLLRNEKLVKSLLMTSKEQIKTNLVTFINSSYGDNPSTKEKLTEIVNESNYFNKYLSTAEILRIKSENILADESIVINSITNLGKKQLIEYATKEISNIDSAITDMFGEDETEQPTESTEGTESSNGSVTINRDNPTATITNSNVITRQDIDKQLKALEEGIVRLVFSKADGSKRVMFATRNKDVIGKYHRFEKKEDYVKFLNTKVSEYIIPVVDLELGLARSYSPSRLYEKDDLGYNGVITFKANSHCWLSNMLAQKNKPKFATLGMEFGSSYAKDDNFPIDNDVENRILSRLNDKGRFDVEEYNDINKNSTAENTNTSGMSQEEIDTKLRIIGSKKQNVFVSYLKRYGLSMRTQEKKEPALPSVILNIVSTEEGIKNYLPLLEFTSSGDTFTHDSVHKFLLLPRIHDSIQTAGMVDKVEVIQHYIDMLDKVYYTFYKEAEQQKYPDRTEWSINIGKYFLYNDLRPIIKENVLKDDIILQKIGEQIKNANELVMSESKLFDFRVDMDMHDIPSYFAENVVLINYMTNKGDYRQLWGTTNPRLLEIFRALNMKESYTPYVPSEKKPSGNFHSAFYIYDAEIGGNGRGDRSIIPSSVVPTKLNAKLPNVISFNPEKHEWYNAMKNPSLLNQLEVDTTTGKVNDANATENAEWLAQIELAQTYIDEATGDNNEELLEARKKLVTASRKNTFIAYLATRGLTPKTVKSIVEPLTELVEQNPEVLNTIKLNADHTDADYTEFLNNPSVLAIVLEAEYKKVSLDIKAQKILNDILIFYKGKITNNTAEVFKKLQNTINMYEINQKYLMTFNNDEEFTMAMKAYIASLITRIVQGTDEYFFDARNLTAQEFEEMLRNNVVYLSFVDGSSKIRRMWGTTNPELVRHYKILSKGDEYRLPTAEEQEELDKFKAELEEKGTPSMQEPFYIYDLQLGKTGDFSRHVIPVRLLSESYVNIPNAIKFPVNGHDWYTYMNQEFPIEEIRSRLDISTGDVTDSGQPNPMFMKEQEYVEDLYDRAIIAENPEAEAEQMLAENTYRMVMHTVKHVKNWTRYDKVLFEQMENTFKKWSEQKYGERYTNNSLTKDDLKMVAKDDENLLLVLQAKGITTYVNPLFMVSDLTMLIHKDRTGMINFGRRAITKEIDFEDIMSALSALVSKRREVTAFEIGKLVKGDEIRMQRLAKFTDANYREEQGVVGIDATFVNANANSHLLIRYRPNPNDKAVNMVMMTPATLMNMTTNQVYHQRKAKESTLSVFMESLKINQNQFPPHVLKAIAIIAEKSFDLRLK